jgi:hypothetical protein
MRKVADWANLEELPLSLVLDKLEDHIEHVRFGVVCKNWQSVAKLNHQNNQFRINKPPMIMILEDEWYWSYTHTKNEKRSLYSISHKEYPVTFFSRMKIIRCMDSSFGWFALVDNNNAITLVNPFKCSSISPIILPHLNSPYKVTLSADPITSPNDYVIAAIYNIGDLAFKRASQPFWIHIAHEFAINNVVFYKGLLFADCEGHTIISFKFNNPPNSNNPNFTYYAKIASTRYSVPSQCYYEKIYFVKSLNGDIWMVRRYFINRYDKSSYKLDVYKLELDAQSGKLEQMNKLESLEDNILFVGNHGDSVSVSASRFSKLEKDSIYFIYDHGMHGLELEIYNAKDGSCQRQFLPISFKGMRGFWVQPQFQWD